MDFGKEFEKFAVKDQGINSNYYNKIENGLYIVPQINTGDYVLFGGLAKTTKFWN